MMKNVFQETVQNRSTKGSTKEQPDQAPAKPCKNLLKTDQ